MEPGRERTPPPTQKPGSNPPPRTSSDTSARERTGTQQPKPPKK